MNQFTSFKKDIAAFSRLFLIYGSLATLSVIGFALPTYFLAYPVSVYALDEPEDEIENELDDEIEDDVENEIDDEIEDDVENEIDDEIEDDVEDEIEDDVDDDIENQIEDDIENEVDDEVDQEIDDSVDDEIEDETENELEENLETEIEDEVENEIDEIIEDEQAERNIEDQSGIIISQQLNLASEQHLESIEISIDNDGHHFIDREWLLVTSATKIPKLSSEGYDVKEIEILKGLDLVVIQIKAPASYDIREIQARLDLRSQKDFIEIDQNHLYAFQSASTNKPNAFQPGDLFPQLSRKDITLGLIDTHINEFHPSLKNCSITQNNFTRNQFPQPNEHGTAIATLLCGQSPLYRGIFKKAQIYSASVFFTHPKYGKSSSALSIIKGINWLVEKQVKVVNLSLAGPHNRILELAIQRATEKNILIVAAVGNSGPTAPKLYPAAYAGVVGVTAVSPKTNKVYRLSGRGDHVDFSAPGVRILHGDGQSSFDSSSGTSFASPFVAALLSLYSLEELVINAKDLGQKGQDPIYGHGLISNPK